MAGGSRSNQVRPATPAAPAADPQRWWALVILMLAGFMNLLDTTIVNVAVPAIQRTYDAGYSSAQWTIAAYSLAFGVFLITGGRLGDIFGRKRMFLIGVTGFTVASALCGAAPSDGLLIAARALEGVMAAVMVPQVLSIIQATFPDDERGPVFGVYGAVLGLSTVCGPVLGGVLINANLFNWSWRPIFLVNVPVGLVALGGAAMLVRESRSRSALRLDPVGVLIVTIGLLMLLYPAVEGRQLGWPAWCFASIAAAVPVFGLFIWYERRRARTGSSPLVVLALFRQRAYVGGLLVNLVLWLGIASFFLIFILYLQLGLGFSALHAGLTTLPFSVAGFIFSGMSVRLEPKLGRPTLVAGAVAMAIGMALASLTIRHYGPHITSWKFAPALAITGLGMGLIIPPLLDYALAGVPVEDAGSASGLLNTFRQLGNAFGIAVIGAIFFAYIASFATSSASSAVPQLSARLRAAGVPAAAQQQLVSDFRACVKDRATAKDPTAVPAVCTRTPQLPAAMTGTVRRIVTASTHQAAVSDFSHALENSLWWVTGVYAFTVIPILMLPRKAPRADKAA